MVLLVHAAFATRPWVQEHLPEWMQALLERMDVGVAIFFVLSGFLLFRPFIARHLAGKPPVKTGTFLRRRSLRVLPGLLVRARRSAWSFLGQMLGSVKNAFLYYSLLFPFASESVALGGGPGQEGNYAIPQAWSLTAEFVFYLMLPGDRDPARAVRRRRRRRSCRCGTRWPSASRSTCSGRCSASTTSSPEPSWERVAVIWAPNWVDFFAIGMATATYSAAHHAGHAAAVAAALPRRPSGACRGAVAGAVGLSFATFSPPDTPGVYGAEYWVRWFLFGVFAFFLLAPAMFGDQTQGSGTAVPRQQAARAARHGVARLLPVPPRGDDQRAGVAGARGHEQRVLRQPARGVLAHVRRRDGAGVPELLPGREAVPAAEGQAGLVVLAAHAGQDA